MSEPIAPEFVAPEANPVGSPKPPPELDGPYDAERALEKIRKANNEAESLRRRIKELEPQAEQFRALEEASKSEAQRLAEQAEMSKRDADTARADAIRYKAAATHGITSDYFDLLGSGTEEEVTARAERLSGLIAAKSAAQTQPPSQPPRRPVEQMRPGATPGDAVDEDEALYQSLFGPQR